MDECLQRLLDGGHGRTKRRRIPGNRKRGTGFPTRLLEIPTELRVVLLQPVPLVHDDQLPEESPLEEVRFRQEHVVRGHHHVEVGRVLHRLLREARRKNTRRIVFPSQTTVTPFAEKLFSYYTNYRYNVPLSWAQDGAPVPGKLVRKKRAGSRRNGAVGLNTSLPGSTESALEDERLEAFFSRICSFEREMLLHHCRMQQGEYTV